MIRSKPQKLCRIPRYRQPRLRKLRSILYRGAKITIYKNHRFEWKIELLKSSMVKIAEQKVIYDCTSRRNILYTRDDAKNTIDSILSPFYYRPWHQML